MPWHFKANEGKSDVSQSRTLNLKKIKICCTHYGNVMSSRGSVNLLWIEQIRTGNLIAVTDPNMKRFIMSLDEAVDLVLFAFEYGESGNILLQKASICMIQTQAETVCELFDGDKNTIKVIGIRHGDKCMRHCLPMKSVLTPLIWEISNMFPAISGD